MYNGAIPCSTDKGDCLWKVAALNSHQFWKSVLGGKKKHTVLKLQDKFPLLCCFTILPDQNLIGQKFRSVLVLNRS